MTGSFSRCKGAQELEGYETVEQFLARGGKIDHRPPTDLTIKERGNYMTRKNSRAKYRDKDDDDVTET